MAIARASLQPRKTPVQARSAYTVEAIFEASIQVLLELGTERLTTTLVAQRAGVSVGTLYQYFPNKQALLQTVLERHLVHVVEAVEAACGQAKGQPVKTMAKSVIDAFIATKMARPDISLALQGVAQEASGAAVVERMTRRSQLALCEMLGTASNARFADLAMISLVLSTALVGPVQAVLAAGAAPAMVEALRGQLTLMISAYLRSAAQALAK